MFVPITHHAILTVNWSIDPLHIFWHNSFLYNLEGTSPYTLYTEFPFLGLKINFSPNQARHDIARRLLQVHFVELR